MQAITAFQFDRAQKAQLFSLDALAAVLLILFILHFGFSAIANLSTRSAEAEALSARQASVLTFADYLLKEGLVHKGASAFGEITYSHTIKSAAARSGEWDRRDSFTWVVGSGCSPLPAHICLCRPVVIAESEEVGFLEVCEG